MRGGRRRERKNEADKQQKEESLLLTEQEWNLQCRGSLELRLEKNFQTQSILEEREFVENKVLR